MNDSNSMKATHAAAAERLNSDSGVRRCRRRPLRSLFTQAEGEFVADFLTRYASTPEVRDNPLFQRFRSLLDSMWTKRKAGQPYEAEVTDLNTIPALVYAEAKRIGAEMESRGDVA